MNWLLGIWRELVALFVDDGSFAAAILAWLAGGFICLRVFELAPATEGIILAIGFILLLAENVERTARNADRRQR
jgi:hypothetical protein